MADPATGTSSGSAGWLEGQPALLKDVDRAGQHQPDQGK